MIKLNGLRAPSNKREDNKVTQEVVNSIKSPSERFGSDFLFNTLTLQNEVFG